MILPILAVLGAMASFQSGAAVAKSLFPVLGPDGASGLRLLLAAIMLIALRRPWRRWPRRAPWLLLLGLGAAMAGTILAFYRALDHLPQGVTVALQFLGPLGIAIAQSRRPSDWAWVALAALGVWCLVGIGGFGGRIDLVSVALALLAAAGWATYILLGRAASVVLGGSTAVLSISIAALLTLPLCRGAIGPILASPGLIASALLMGAFASAIPSTLEFFAMPKMPARTFSIWMSLEPAVAALSGLLFLSERLSVLQMVGIAAVILAAAGATWTSTRHTP